MQPLVNPVQLQSVSSPARLNAQRDQAHIRATAEDFEASFLSQMLKPMFEGLQTDGPFGGGSAETTWRSFLVDAMAKQTVKTGGIGLADRVVAEMLKTQEQPK